MTQSNAFDNEAAFRRLRSWTPGGLGKMGPSALAHQMGWTARRTSATVSALIEEGSIVQAGPVGALYVTTAGIAKYEGEEAASRWKPVLESWGLT